MQTHKHQQKITITQMHEHTQKYKFLQNFTQTTHINAAKNEKKTKKGKNTHTTDTHKRT